MENKPTSEKGTVDENMDQNPDNQDVNQEAEKKVTLKNQKPDKANAGDTDEKWKKVDSIVSVAKDAYQSGKSGFRDVVESMIATLQDLLASEEGGGGLGGLYGGPQMDIPAGPEPPADDQPQ
jgi:ethanolamine utilization cobalamin adenosyltransferase